MTAADVDIILERAIEKFPGAKPRIISGNGPQFIATDFIEFIRVAGRTHVKTAPTTPSPTAESNAGIGRS